MAALLSSNRWAEIALYVRSTIERGDVRPGEPLPSVRNLAAQLNCAPGTVQQAYKDLERQGLVRSVPLRGYFVAETAELVDAATHAALLERFNAFFTSLRNEGFSDRAITAALRAYKEQHA